MACALPKWRIPDSFARISTAGRSTSLRPCPSEPRATFANRLLLVGLADELCGVLSVRCTANAATTIASPMLGVAITDAASSGAMLSETSVNLEAGNFKAKIDGLQDKCVLSVSTVSPETTTNFIPLRLVAELKYPSCTKEKRFLLRAKSAARWAGKRPLRSGHVRGTKRETR